MSFDRKLKLVPDSAQVIKAQKELPYTVTTIGDEAQLAKWKVDRFIADAAYKTEASKRYESRRTNAVDIVMGQNTSLVFSKAEHEEIQANKKRHTKVMTIRKSYTPPVEEAKQPTSWLSKVWNRLTGK